MKINIKLTLSTAKEIKRSLKWSSLSLEGINKKNNENMVNTIVPPVQKLIFIASALLISVYANSRMFFAFTSSPPVKLSA